MGLGQDDIVISMTLLADTKEASAKLNRYATQLKQLEAAMLRTNAIMKARGVAPVFSELQIRSVQRMNAALQHTAVSANTAGRSLLSLNNFSRTVFGTLTAMSVFLVTQFVGQAFAKAIDSIKQLELAIFNLAVAERTLSKAGVDITPQNFKDIIESVMDLNLAISEIDVTKSVADLATGMRDLGLSFEQMEGLSRAAAVIAVSKGLTMDDVVKQFVLGIAKNGRGLADLDIQVDASVIKQKALDAQLVKNEESWNRLTAAQRQSIETQALYLIIMDSAEDKLSQLGLLEDTVMQKTRQLDADWESFTATLGVTFAPAIKSGLDLLIALITAVQERLDAFGEHYVRIYSMVIGASVAVQSVLDGHTRSLEDMRALTKQATAEAAEMLRQFMVPEISQEDTPTGPKSGIEEGLEESQEDLQGALDKMNNAILEAQIRLAHDMEDVAIDLGRKLVDIAEEYATKRADAEKAYEDKVRDINASYIEKTNDIRNKEAEANAKARNDELEREAEFQNKMLELKENYLMDLEDALHERDARQVIRLMKQYNLDKLQAGRKHELDKGNAARDFALRRQEMARERVEAENDRRTKLAVAAREYQDKLEKLKAEEEAEAAAAQLSYERKMQDLQREMHNRLAMVGAGLVQEFNLTKHGLNNIYTLYKSYFGSISKIYSAMNAMLSGQRISSGYAPSPVSVGKSMAGHGFAEGGTMVADRPTTVTFGEAGLEMASFTPIGRNGRDINKMFSNLSAGGGSGSDKVEIGVTLSPDLEARIMSNTLDRAGRIVTKVRASKVR